MPTINASFAFVAAGIASWLVITAYCSAEAQAQLRADGIAATAARTTFAALPEF